MATHYDIVHLTEVGSTQDEAATRFERKGRPTLVVADRQIAGRGRQGRRWEQPDRGMFSSLSFGIDWVPDRRTLVPLIAGLVVAEAIEAADGERVSLKWPNDLMRDRRKTGGILVELHGDRITVGGGVNLWWADPMEGATSVFDADPGPGAAIGIAGRWADALLAEIDRGPAEWRKADYLSRSASLGQTVEWDGGTGRAVGVDASGALIVDTLDGLETIHAGDVHLRNWH